MTPGKSPSAPPRRAIIAALGGAALLAPCARPSNAASSPEPLPGPWSFRGVVKRSGGQISYATLGEGEPLVLLHKLGGSLADWRGAAPLLAAAGRKVIAVDLPGHGQSFMLGSPPYIQTVPETATMIKAALEELGVSRYALAGNSLGGVAGVILAACWPRTISKLALVSVSLIPAMTRAQVDQLDRDVRSAFGPNWEPLPRPQSDIDIVGFNDPKVLEEDNMSRARTGVWLRPAERGVAVAGVTDYLPRITAPTLVLTADRGRYVKYGDVAKAAMSDVRVVRITDSGSFIHQEKPAEAAAAINAFLAA
jgi:pimeloyl-ACP methyl ester carboxylesterase